MKSIASSILATPLLFSCLVSAISLDCKNIQVDKVGFNLFNIGGPHKILVHDEDRPPSVYNTTWTIDICQPLKKVKDVPAGDQCGTGTHVCGIVKSWNPVDDPDAEHVEIANVIPIAGNYQTSTGRDLDPKFTRLKSEDTSMDGLKLELHGGYYNKRKQRAVINFECDKDRTGNEGNEAAAASILTSQSDDEEKDNPNSLTFVSYGPVDGKENVDVLRLNWRTKYSCEDAKDGESGGDKSKGWGFFTWFILIFFLGVSAYLIFASWLNYNRYGARGWDLVPHGDTIRDIPYLFKDWSRKVVDTVQGGGSRGGYSAV